MSIYQPQVKQCKEAEAELLSLQNESISLHGQVISLGAFDLRAFELDRKVRALQKNLPFV